MAKVLLLIPARYQSSRFPGKPLVPLKNKPMISWVYENCAASGYDSYVITDDSRIEEHCLENKMNVIRVDDDVPSGTERIALAFERNFKGKYDCIINVQGDEPLLKASEIEKLAKFHQDHDYDCSTLVRPRESSEKDDYINPNVVKVHFAQKRKQCLSFSRAPLPFSREESEFTWYQHIGVYCFSPKLLNFYLNSSTSSLEDIEKLEQLRALEEGFTIGGVETNYKSIGVDHPDDVKKIEEVLSE